MISRDKIVATIRGSVMSHSKRIYCECFDIPTSSQETESFILSLLIVTEPTVDTYNSVFGQVIAQLKTLSGAVRVIRVDSHSAMWIEVSLPPISCRVFLGCVSPSQSSRDELSSFIESSITGLKPSRDDILLRQLLTPRLWCWFEQWLSQFEESLRESVRYALNFLVDWSKCRQILGDGFLTVEIIAMMLVHIFPITNPSPFGIVQKFMRYYSCEFEMNEASVASQVCRPSGNEEEGYYGSLINEDEGIDSDVDEELRHLRLSRRKNPETAEPDDVSATEHHSLLSKSANENDDVHPHKYLRYELGQIRDIRCNLIVENSRVKKIGYKVDHTFKHSLDLLDVLTVCHPSPGCELAEGEHVNLAVRVLESHKKIILQELVRANMMICDCIGDDPSTIFQILSTPIGSDRENECQFICELQVVSFDDEETALVVSRVLQEQSWFFVQEMQAICGVMVIPLTPTQDTVRIGLTFVCDEPYGAMEDQEIDLIGPISRVMLRSKKCLEDRFDYAEKLHGKFTVQSRVVENTF